jgi:hypothetical protein
MTSYDMNHQDTKATPSFLCDISHIADPIIILGAISVFLVSWWFMS